MPHDTRHMIDLYQHIREDDRRRQMLHQDMFILMSATVSEDTGMGQNRALHAVVAVDTTLPRHRSACDVPFQDAV